MPAGWPCWFDWPAAQHVPLPSPCRGKKRGVTQSPKRAKRRNRRKP